MNAAAATTIDAGGGGCRQVVACFNQTLLNVRHLYFSFVAQVANLRAFYQTGSQINSLRYFLRLFSKCSITSSIENPCL